MRMPVFREMKRWGKMLPLLLLSSLLFAACGGNSPTILNPAGPVADQEANLFWFILVVATIVFVFVEGWLILNVVRFRERPNSPQPHQIHGNNTVELIWTVAPSIVLFLVLAFTIRTMFGLAATSRQSYRGASRRSPVVVGVQLHQKWRCHHRRYASMYRQGRLCRSISIPPTSFTASGFHN